MPTIAEIRAKAAAKTAELLSNSPGQAAANLVEELKAKAPLIASKEPSESRRYFAKIAGSRFIFSDGVEVFFHYGRLDVGPENNAYPTMENMWPAYQKELNAILGRNPNIFVAEATTEKVPEVEQNALSEADLAAREANLSGLPQKTRQEMGTNTVGAGAPTNVNESTVDPKLREAMLGTISTEGAAEKAAQQNAGAATN